MGGSGLKERIRRIPGRAMWLVDGLFDLWHRTDTSGRTMLDDAGVQSDNLGHGFYYEPVPAHVFRRALAALPIDHKDFTFVDLGSGKGRALLLAAEYPFAEIIGVEFAEKLHRVAQENLQDLQKKGANIRSIHADAANYAFPDTNLVIYIFNSFDEVVFKEVLAKLAVLGRTRALYVIYVTATYSAEIEASGVLSHKKAIPLPLITLRKPQALKKLFVYSNRGFLASVLVASFCLHAGIEPAPRARPARSAPARVHCTARRPAAEFALHGCQAGNPTAGGVWRAAEAQTSSAVRTSCASAAHRGCWGDVQPGVGSPTAFVTLSEDCISVV